MESLMNEFVEKDPLIVFEWNDSKTDAVGWLVINSLRGGAAGGGTRMRKGLNKQEVISLAKTMEVKFTVSGPPIGGAKSGINFDPNDPRKKEVLERWFHDVMPLLKTYYGTGGDMNVDEVNEVIPITEGYGLWHPQEGTVIGHFKPRENEKVKIITQLRKGVSKEVEDSRYTPDIKKKFKVADLITGYGVAESIRHHYDLFNEEIKGKRAIVQGWGNVGATAAYYLAQQGVNIVGILDKEYGIIETEGLSPNEVTELVVNRKGNKLNSEKMIPFQEVNDKIWGLNSEIFIPCAASRLVTKDQLDKMIDSGLEVIASGANVPFADSELFFGPIADHADRNVTVIPDFISNCGMARVFAYCEQPNNEISDEAIFLDTSNTIKRAIKESYMDSQNKTGLSRKAFEIALKQLI
ncbi:MAG: Glu/Leu/Phe/Val dehydrogenase dimerization domain-containing protein [Flavobacteriales bacterium]